MPRYRYVVLPRWPNLPPLPPQRCVRSGYRGEGEERGTKISCAAFAMQITRIHIYATGVDIPLTCIRTNRPILFFFPITTSLSPLPSFPIFSRRVTKRSSNEKRDSKSFLFPLARTFYLILPSSVGYFYPREVRVKWMFPGIKSSSRSRALWLFHLSSYVTSAHGEKRRCNDGGVATVLLSPGNECGPRRIDTVYIVLPSSEISCERVFVVVGRKNSRVTDNRYPPRLFPRSSMKIHDWKMRRMVSALSCQFIDFLSISTINWYRISVFTT